MYSSKRFFASLSRILRSLLLATVPSFYIVGYHSDITATNVPPTAWLDGMRGYAAFAVFLRHFEFCHHRRGLWSWGTINDVKFPYANRSFFQLPIVRLLYHGEGMVCLFFVISGYVLSYKSLILMRQHEHDKLFRHLSSSVFKRPFRLYLPCLASTATIFACLRLGVYDKVNTLFENEEQFRKLFLGFAREFQPHIFTTFEEQLADYISGLTGLFSIITKDHWPAPKYDPHLWTISVEFRCSMILFLTQAGLAFATMRARITILAILTVLAFPCDVWELGLFWGGMLIAELGLIHKSQQQNAPGCELIEVEVRKKHDSESSLGWFIAFFVGLVLLSCPSQETEHAPLYSTLINWCPWGLRREEHFRFWCSIGAFIVVFVVDHEVVLQKPFSCGFGRYLGKISYALYVMHGLVNQTVGYLSVYWFWINVTGRTTNQQYENGVVLGGLLTSCVLVWVADLFWRHVDVPIVRFTQRLDRKLRQHP